MAVPQPAPAALAPAALAGSLAGSVTTLSALIPQADQCLPVADALVPLFPYGGLVRGQVVGCGGSAGVSLAVAAAAHAVEQGSWLAVVGLREFGVEAASELGLPLERVVMVDGGRSPLEWADRVAACADGFDVVLVDRVPNASLLRRVRQRLQARGSVLLAVDVVDGVSGDGISGGGRTDGSGAVVGREGLSCDAYLNATESRWVGIGSGHGALLARMVTVSASGRRVRQATPPGAQGQADGYRLWLPGPSGRVEEVSDGPTNHHRLVS